MTADHDETPDLTALLNSCVYCERLWSEHVNGQCLFQSTRYLSYERAILMANREDLIRKYPRLDGNEGPKR